MEMDNVPQQARPGPVGRSLFTACSQQHRPAYLTTARCLSNCRWLPSGCIYMYGEGGESQALASRQLYNVQAPSCISPLGGGL
jgi:hypothetical protein